MLAQVHHLTIPHAPLTRLQRVLLTFHHLYKPEHHPNHPRHTLKLGQEVILFLVVVVKRFLSLSSSSSSCFVVVVFVPTNPQLRRRSMVR